MKTFSSSCLSNSWMGVVIRLGDKGGTVVFFVLFVFNIFFQCSWPCSYIVIITSGFFLIVLLKLL